MSLGDDQCSILTNNGLGGLFVWIFYFNCPGFEPVIYVWHCEPYDDYTSQLSPPSRKRPQQTERGDASATSSTSTNATIVKLLRGSHQHEQCWIWTGPTPARWRQPMPWTYRQTCIARENLGHRGWGPVASRSRFDGIGKGKLEIHQSNGLWWPNRVLHCGEEGQNRF